MQAFFKKIHSNNKVLETIFLIFMLKAEVQNENIYDKNDRKNTFYLKRCQ